MNFVKTTQFGQLAAIYSQEPVQQRKPLPTHLNIVPSLLQVTLKIDEKEVDYALQDKTLLSSILQEGMPTTS